MKRYFSHTIGVLLLLLLVPLFQRCSTEKNTFASRTYHKITSKYNVYFNANESLKEGVEQIEERIENDYTRLLPVYKASDASAANLVKSDMENAVLKASKLIEIHSITAKPRRRSRRTRSYQEFASKEEFNPWVDDSYLLIGKAYFYQHNFPAAIDNLSYVLRKFPEGDARYEAYIWLIRSYSELGRFTEASERLKDIQNDPDFPGKLERELAIATADFYKKQQEYSEAIKFIDLALDKTFWKKQKARLQYIKAQLYEEMGMPAQATEAYEAVTKMNADYKMAFNAKINAAGLFSGEGDSEKNRKELRKMLRDKKNIEFLDQIYFALGNIFLQEGNRDLAIENFRKSVASSFDNQFQRAQSAITLAELYFEDLEYRAAQSYYDSAMIIIDETYPDYTKLSAKYRNLTNLVENLVTVEEEDSLQRIANMPQTERESLIARLMQEEQERRRNMENLAVQDQRSQGYYRANRNRRGLGRGQEGAGWYFYNPQIVSYGKVTFQQRWGNRNLGDDWRRSNKGAVSMDEMEEMAEVSDSSQIESKVRDPLKKEFYTQNLPLNDSLMELSHERIIEALFHAGRIFKSEFSNYQRSAEAFEELIERYPTNDYLLSTYYELYDLYEMMGNSARSGTYRNLIVSKFPDSKYAQYLTNPDFFVEMEARSDSLNSLYEQTFKSYRSGNYRNVITLCSSMKEMETDSTVLPKIDFMETIALGTQTDIHTFEEILKDYIEQYPVAEPTTLATEILTLIQDSTLADYQKLVEMGYLNEEIQNEELLTQVQAENDEFGGKFSYEDDLLHYFVIVYPREADIDLNRLKFDIANYNIDHYTRKDFDIETENLNDEQALVVVRVLENKENGVIYHRAIIRNASVFETLRDYDYVNFSVSSTNYRQILSEGSVADYLKFFVKNYSRFIGPDFSDEKPELSPEELMAKAREEEDILRERGEFVRIETGAVSAGIFSADIDTTQSFVLAVENPDFSMRPVLKGFAAFNRSEYKRWNLALEQKTVGNYQLLIARGIPSLNESMSYFRKVVISRDLFEPLGRKTYRNFLITEDNLQKLIEEEKVEDYIDFFRNYYINRNQNQTGTSESLVNEPADEEETSPEDESQGEPEVYTGPYSKNLDKAHYFVFVIPKTGIDKAAFVEGLEQFNASGDFSLSLAMKEQSLDDFRENVVISGFPDKESATRYFRMVVQNRDLFEPLGEGSYRNFLITEDNYAVFLKEKNITGYMDFYKQIYLGE